MIFNNIIIYGDIIARKKETKKQSLIPELYRHPTKKRKKARQMKRDERGRHKSLLSPLHVPSGSISSLFLYFYYYSSCRTHYGIW